MADFEITLRAKLDESSLDGIKQRIKKYEDELKTLKIEPQVNAKAISDLENKIKVLEEKLHKIEIDLDTSKASSAMDDLAKQAGKAGEQAGKQFSNAFSNGVQSGMKTAVNNLNNQAKQFASSANKLVQEEERKQQAIDKTTEAAKKQAQTLNSASSKSKSRRSSRSKSSSKTSGSSSTQGQTSSQKREYNFDYENSLANTKNVPKAYGVSNNAAVEAAADFKKLLDAENAVISVTRQFSDTDMMKGFTVSVKRATGEVESFRYAYEQEFDKETGKTTWEGFSYKGSQVNNSGAIKQVRAIENEYSRYSKKLAQFESTNNQILSGLTKPIASFKSTLDEFRSGTKTIDDVKQSFDSLNIAASDITKNFNRQLNPVDAALRKYNNADTIVKDFETEIKGLKNVPDDVNSDLNTLKTNLEKLQDLQKDKDKGGFTAEWATQFRAWSDDADKMQARINSLKKEQSNQAFTQIFDLDKLKDKGIPYMTKMSKTVEGQMQEIQKMAKSNGFDIIDVSGIEKAEGQIKQLTLTVQNAEGAIQKFTMQRAQILSKNRKVKKGAKNPEPYNGLVQMGDVRTLKTSDVAAKELTDSLLKSYQKLNDLEVKRAGLDTSKDVQQVQALDHEIEILRAEYEGLLNDAQGKKFFDSAGFEQGKAAIDAETQFRIGNTEEAKEAAAAYEKLRDIANQVGNTEIKLAGLDPTKNVAEIDALTAKLEELKTDYDETYASLSAKGIDLSPAQFEDLGNIIETAEEKVTELKEKLKDKIQVEIDSGKIETQLTNVETKMARMSDVSDKVKDKVKQLRDAFDIMNDPSASIDDKIAAFRQFNSILPSVTNDLKQLGQQYKLTADEQNVLTRSDTLSNNIQTWMNNNTKAAKEYGEALKQLQTQLKDNTDPQVYKKANADFQNIKSQAKAGGLVKSGVFNQLKDTALSMIGLGSVAEGINTMVSGVKNGISSITALDTALVDLKKTAEMTSEQLEQFYYSSNDVAKEMGVSTEDIINQASAWSRLNSIGLLHGNM